jgi:hypothetical protein
MWYILCPFGNVVVIWYIFLCFGILCREKSGNPVSGWLFSPFRPCEIFSPSRFWMNGSLGMSKIYFTLRNAIGRWKQGCQMVYFRTRNTNLGKFRRVLQWKMLVHIYGHLVYLRPLGKCLAIWSILRPLGKCQAVWYM